ncbi:MAG TPA: hypothetical protein VGA08_03275 [Candidatus Saccharimonadales bacterium]
MSDDNIFQFPTSQNGNEQPAANPANIDLVDEMEPRSVAYSNGSFIEGLHQQTMAERIGLTAAEKIIDQSQKAEEFPEISSLERHRQRAEASDMLESLTRTRDDEANRRMAA